MRKSVISVVSVCVVLLAAFAIFALPVYNINDQTLVDRLDEKIEYIKEHDDPIAKVDQIFTKEIFDKANNGKVEFDEYAKQSWDVTYYETLEEENDGVTFKGGIKLKSNDIKDLKRISIWAKGESSKLLIKVNDNLVEEITLTNELTPYVINIKEVESANLELYFTSTSTIHRIKINEDDPATFKDATKILLDRIILFSGLIINDVTKIDIAKKTIYEDVTSVLSGVSYFDLFNMLIRDIKYDYNIAKQLFQTSKQVNLPFKAMLNYYSEQRFCPFVSALIFLSASSIFASMLYIVVGKIVDLILKKKTTNTLIPSFVILGALCILLNISTFIPLSFYNDTHNIATEYRLLFFEVAKITPSFYAGIAIIFILALINYIDVVFDYKESLKLKTKTNIKVKFIVFTSLMGLFTVLFILGLLVH